MVALRAAAVPVVLGKLLPDADRLEVHAEHGRGAAGGRAVMREAVDFVDDGRHLQAASFATVQSTLTVASKPFTLVISGV